MAVVTIVLVLQNTKKALLPAKQTPVLWAAEAVAIACVLVLRSGWGRDARWAEEQGELGHAGEQLLRAAARRADERRRHRRSACSARSGGRRPRGACCSPVCAAACPRRGLIDFVVAAVVGAITGGSSAPSRPGRRSCVGTAASPSTPRAAYPACLTLSSASRKSPTDPPR